MERRQSLEARSNGNNATVNPHKNRRKSREYVGQSVNTPTTSVNLNYLHLSNRSAQRVRCLRALQKWMKMLFRRQDEKDQTKTG